MTLTVDRKTLDLLTVDEASQALRLSKNATLALIHRGQLRASRLGKVYRIERPELAACVRRLERPQPPGGGQAA